MPLGGLERLSSPDPGALLPLPFRAMAPLGQWRWKRRMVERSSLSPQPRPDDISAAVHEVCCLLLRRQWEGLLLEMAIAIRDGMGMSVTDNPSKTRSKVSLNTLQPLTAHSRQLQPFSAAKHQAAGKSSAVCCTPHSPPTPRAPSLDTFCSGIQCLGVRVVRHEGQARGG
jgi:hypothetical protein